MRGDSKVILIACLVLAASILLLYEKRVAIYRTLFRAPYFSYEERAFVEAPAGDAGAWYIVASGDATTDFATAVFVTPRRKPDDPDDVCKQCTMFLGDGEHDLRLRWLDGENLEITCLDPAKKVQIRRDRKDSISMHYVNCAPPVQRWIR